MNPVIRIGNMPSHQHIVGLPREEVGIKECLCIIPAYTGGEDKRSNMMPLAGKPLLAYTIETALESQEFDDVLVTSDDEDALSLAESRGVLTDIILKAPGVGTRSLIESVVKFVERARVLKSYRHVALMLPRCPLRSIEDVNRAMDRYREQKAACTLITVTPYAFPPEFAMRYSSDDHCLRMRDPGIQRRMIRNQMLSATYQPNGALYVTSTATLVRQRTYFVDPMIGYVMPPRRSLDINDPHQLGIARYIVDHPVKDANN